jgi:hypothetical protein
MEDRTLAERELRQPVFNRGSQVKLLATADDAICYGLEKCKTTKRIALQ